ncbi:unnamed protein product [Urochloa decumbens]|uniref:Uncharacterized protein n=1 Tax=Urochloa decumbens TaxID=240449 RepID=A0ABC9FG57_9POAL
MGVPADLLPEGWLNIFILCTALVYKAMSGLGTLATVWATVVLLGGFSTLVKQTDFWYITIIAFLQTIGIFGGYEDPAHQFFMRAPDALRKEKNLLDKEHGVSWRRRHVEEPQQIGDKKRAASRRKDDNVQFCGMDAFSTWFGNTIHLGLKLTQLAAVGTCMALSCKRLIKQDYVDEQYLQHDDHRNIKRSLNIFYVLVLAQGTVFTLMLLNPFIRMQIIELRRQYMLYSPSGRDIVYRYKNDNYMEFIMGNVRPTLNMDLVKFAKNLVVSSTIDDQLLGVRTIDYILRSFIGDKTRNQVLARLQASLDPEATSTLVSMLGLTINISEEEDIRGHAARLVLKLAPGLLVECFPTILHLISSLLSTEKEMRDMDLVWFGLRILDKLTDNPENCRQAKDSDDLLSKIICLTNLCSHATMGGRSSESWMEEEVLPLLLREEEIPTSYRQKIDEEIIVGISLNVLRKLVAAPGEAGKDLRRKTIESVHFNGSTRIISAHAEAARVISCLALDDKPRAEIGRSPEIIKNLKNCLLLKTPHMNMPKVAAKLLLLEYASSEQLHEIQLLEKYILENQAVLPSVLTVLEELDLEYLDTPRWVNRIIQRLDMEDFLSVPRVNTAEAAAQALVMLSTGFNGCQENIEAILEDLHVEELQVVVNMLFAEYGEKRRSTEVSLEQYNLGTKMLQTIKKIVCTEDRKIISSMIAKLLQNLRGYTGTRCFDPHMHIIDAALPEVLTSIIHEVVRLENAESTSENMAHSNKELRIKQGKLLEGLISLAVKICTSMNNASNVIKTLENPNVTVCTLVQKLKKVLEVYKSPGTAYPGIRKSTIELMTWMIRNNSNYIEILLQCGVYEQLEDVAKTARELENFELFYCDVGVGHHETPIYSLARELRDQLSLSPKFQERSHCYKEHASSITVLIA